MATEAPCPDAALCKHARRCRRDEECIFQIALRRVVSAIVEEVVFGETATLHQAVAVPIARVACVEDISAHLKSTIGSVLATDFRFYGRGRGRIRIAARQLRADTLACVRFQPKTLGAGKSKLSVNCCACQLQLKRGLAERIPAVAICSS